MAQSTTSKLDVREWSPRARLYGMALVITLSYMLIGRLNNDNDSWVQVSLPLSSASLLLVSLAAAETYLLTTRLTGWDLDTYQHWLATTCTRLSAPADRGDQDS